MTGGTTANAATHAARATATVALAALLAACSRETVSSSERLSFGSQPAGGGRVVVEGAATPRAATPRAAVEPVARVPWGGGVLPLVRGDGRCAAIEASGGAPREVRLGDPLPPTGLDCELEVVSLEVNRPGAPLSRLRGPWILGRGSSAQGYLVERPHADGRRDIALAGWEGGVTALVEDDRCNAHAAIAPDGALAWSHRGPEAGEWRLAVRRDGRTARLESDPGSDWLMPTFSGDGKGLFAIELRGTAASFTYVPFGADGLPAPGACTSPARLRSPASALANLSWAMRACEPFAGGAASPPGSAQYLAWLPDAGCVAVWSPGSEPVRLAAGSLAGLMVDEGNALVTVQDAVLRQVLGAPPPHPVIAAEPWVPRPVNGSPGEAIGMIARSGQVQFARLRLRPGDASP